MAVPRVSTENKVNARISEMVLITNKVLYVGGGHQPSSESFIKENYEYGVQEYYLDTFLLFPQSGFKYNSTCYRKYFNVQSIHSVGLQKSLFVLRIKISRTVPHVPT